MTSDEPGKPLEASVDRTRLFHAAVVLILSVLLYANSIPGDFVFDDVVLIQNDSRLRDFDSGRIFFENYWGTQRASPNYRPLVLLSYALNYRISAEAWHFHLVNVLLNAAVALVFLALCRQLFRGRGAALLTACLFTAFPIHTEAVCNIVGRAELLSALFVFSAWYLVQRSPVPGAGRAALLVLLVFLGLCAKENAVAAVALIPLGIYFSRRVFVWRPVLLASVAVACYFAWRQYAIADMLEKIELNQANTRTLVDNPFFYASGAERVFNAIRLLGLYALKTIVPLHLSADYSFNQIAVLPLSSAVLWVEVLGVVGAAVFLAVVGLRRIPLVGLGTLAFLVALLPVSNLFFPIGTLFAERLAYLPSAGLAILLAAFAEWLAGRLEARAGGRVRRLPFAMLTALVLIYAWRGVDRSAQWSPREDMYLQMAEDAPRSTRAQLKSAEGHVIKAQQVTGAARAEHYQKAYAAIEASNRIYLSHPDRDHNNPRAQAFLGELLLKDGKYGEALRAIRDARAILARVRLEEPKLFKLEGEASLRLNLVAEAEKALGAYLLIQERRGQALDVEALSQRGVARVHQKKIDLARQDFDHAIELAPDIPNLYNNRAFFRKLIGDPDGALEDYRQGLELCVKLGRIVTPPGENARVFHERIFALQLSLGRFDLAREEITAVRALGASVSAEDIVKLEKALEEAVAAAGFRQK